MKVKISEQLYIRLLEEEAEYQKNEANIATKGMEREQELRRQYEEEVGKLFFKNNIEEAQNAKLRLMYYDLNDDFFILGEMFMASKMTIADIVEPKLKAVSDDFMGLQYRQRIDYLEELIFDFGDDIEQRDDIISDAAEEISNLKKDIADIQAEWARGASDWSLAGKMRDAELSDSRRALKELADETEMKERVRREAIYEDKKCRYDLEQKIIAMEKEKTELIERLAAEKDKDECGDNKIGGPEGDAGCDNEGKTSIKAGEGKTGRIKWPAKDLLTGEAIKDGLKEGMEAGGKVSKKTEDPRDPKGIATIACKNKLVNKGYDVETERKTLIATKKRHAQN